jgi:hypothetical protein
MTIDAKRYALDLDAACRSIRQMNSSTTMLATDRVLAGMFASAADLTRPGAVAERVAVLDGLWGTRLFMESGAADRIVASLERNAASLVATLSALGPDDLELEPERVIEAAQVAMPTILNHTVDGDVRFRENYSFATKFFHWCTRVHFPIVDSRARRKINSMQVAAGVRPRIRSDTAAMNGLMYLKEYERWIVFYAEVIAGLAVPERAQLCRTDYDSQPTDCRVKHSLLRILDKVFYVQGGGSGLGRVAQ